MGFQGVQHAAARLNHRENQGRQHLKAAGINGKRRPQRGLQALVGVLALTCLHRENTLLEPTFLLP